MAFPETELNRIATKKKLSKQDIIGMSPMQYILYRINIASGQDIQPEQLKMALESITLDMPKPGENCREVAVVNIKAADDIIWHGELNYRIPRINIGDVYGDVHEITSADLALIDNYEDYAREHLLPPKNFHPHMGEIDEGVVSYRLVFQNAFFEGELVIRVTEVEDLSTTLQHLYRVFGQHEPVEQGNPE